MSIFVFIIVAIVVSSILGPIAKGMGDRLSRGGPGPDELRRLAAELEAANQRLADTERRLHDAEERLDFQEKLLSTRASRREAGEP